MGACGVGFGVAAGGGGSSLISTRVGAEIILPPPEPGATGLIALLFPQVGQMMVCVFLRIGGMSLAFAETSFGTVLVSVTSEIASLRTSTFFATSCFSGFASCFC